CKCTTIKDAAAHLGVSWDIIKDIQQRNLHRRFGKPKLKNLKEIAIDEIAIGKGHAYFTVVLDLRSGAVVYVGDGKGVVALTAFWKRLRASSQGPSGGHRHEQSLHPSRARPSSQGRARVRSLPCPQAVQRKTHRVPPRVVSR